MSEEPANSEGRTPEITLIQGDCLEMMNRIPDQSVNFIFACLPKATETALNPRVMFSHIDRIMIPKSTVMLLPPNGSVFADLVVASRNSKFPFRFEMIGKKPQGTNPLMVHVRPLKNHEIYPVFQDSPKQCTYTPQMTTGLPYSGYEAQNGQLIGGQWNATPSRHRTNLTGARFPTTVQQFPQARKRRGFHADGQPEEVAAYFIKTYSKPNDKVLDFCMGSGTTGVAALREHREFVGIELLEKYCQTALNRLTSVQLG